MFGPCREGIGGVMTALIPRNTTIPTRKSQVISTYLDNAPYLSFEVYEGERGMTKDNFFIGIYGIPPAPRGVPQIELTFDIDANAILTVIALNEDTGMKKTVISWQAIPKEELEVMIADARMFQAEDYAEKARIESKNQLEEYMLNLRDKLSELQRVVDSPPEWMDSSQELEQVDYEKKQKEIAAAVSKMYQEISRGVPAPAPTKFTQDAREPGKQLVGVEFFHFAKFFIKVIHEIYFLLQDTK